MLKHQTVAEGQRNALYYPDTARQAVSRAVEMQDQTETQHPQVRALATRKERNSFPFRPLNRQERSVLGGVPLLYGLLLFTIAWFPPITPGYLVPLLIFFLPPLAAFLSGAFLNSKRLGVLSGALITGCMIGGILGAMHLQNISPHIGRDDIQQMLGITVSGLCSGLAGAGLRQFFHNLRHN